MPLLYNKEDTLTVVAAGQAAAVIGSMSGYGFNQLAGMVLHWFTTTMTH
jgi:hypothetical protein